MQSRCGHARVKRAQMDKARKTRLENMTMIELRALCKKKEIKGYSGLNKDKLIKKIMGDEKKKRLNREKLKIERFEKREDKRKKLEIEKLLK